MTQSLKMSQSLDSFVQIVSLASAFSGLVGSGSALVVDFYRRRVRAKASEYAAAAEFNQVISSVSHLQETLEKHMKTSQGNHADISQRVARLEGKHDD